VPPAPPTLTSVPALPPLPAAAELPPIPATAPVPPVCVEPPSPDDASGASVQPPNDHTNKSAPSGALAIFLRPPRQYLSVIAGFLHKQDAPEA
jgi:hypothetical protein